MSHGSVHTTQETSGVCKICWVVIWNRSGSLTTHEGPSIINPCGCPVCARFAITGHRPLPMRKYISQSVMWTLKICYVHFVSKFSKLEHHKCAIIGDTGKGVFTSAVLHFFFFFSQCRVWTQGLHLEPLHLFCEGIFQDRISQTICLGWLPTVILLISWVARIAGMTRWRPAQLLSFKEKMEHKTQCHQMFKKPK
jgi:hypothetical protein